MYSFKEKQKPFLPSRNFQGLGREPAISPIVHIKPKPQKIPMIVEMKDAETGEIINYTRARWSSQEGRLELNAQTIVDMGTGRLDLKERNTNKNTARRYQKGHIDHPLVSQFIDQGPLTPIMHKYWNPRTNEVDYNLSDNNNLQSLSWATSTVDTNDNSSSGMNNLNSESLDLSTISPMNNRSDMLSVPRSVASPSASTQLTSMNPGKSTFLPPNISLGSTMNWNILLEQTFTELYSIAEKIEITKSLTLETKTFGGLKEVQKICRNLATQKVKYMKELVQAIDDEARKEQMREKLELENCDKPEYLKELQKIHRNDRKKGKIYIEALQRDQEIIFMVKLRDAGLLW